MADQVQDREQLLFGVQTPTQRPFRELAEQWTFLEGLGFDNLWLADHYVPPFKLDGPIFEPWTLLAALALVTKNIRFGVLVSCNTFRHPPLVAKEAVTLDHISNGRLEFGLGAGWFVPEHEMFGIPFPGNAELVGRFKEAVEICNALFTQDVTTYEGEYYQVRDAPFRPAPVQDRIPFTLGAHGPRMMRIVARYADRWNSTGTLEEMAARNTSLDEACVEVGRPPHQVLRSHLYVKGILPQEVNPWESPEALRDFVGRFSEIGIREFILQPPPGTEPAQIERTAETIADLRAGGAR